MIRLQRYLAECGVASRRASEELIRAGRIRVNGAVAALGQSIDPAIDAVECDGKAIRKDGKVYILLNKPKGTVTSARDTHSRKTVLDCLDGVAERVFPVGRLDLDTEGALLLTNDGDLAYALTHPKFGVPKVYLARVQGQVSQASVAMLRKGVRLEDGVTAPAQVAIVKTMERQTLLRLTLTEGKKREVKRMCEAVGHRVRELKRTAFANLTVAGLEPGQWRPLDANELAALRKAAGV